MSRLDTIRENLIALQEQIIEIVGSVMLQHKEEITALLINQQAEQGIDSAGQPLRAYSRRYLLEKEQLGLYRGFTDFNLTGEFHGDMDLSVNGSEYTFNSTAETNGGILKSAWLDAWNKKGGGGEIMELTDENVNEVWSIISEDVKAHIEEIYVFD